MIDIHGGSKNPIAARLSNFTDRPFVFDGIVCAGLEGILQALKVKASASRVGVCAMSGKQAKKAGEAHNGWKKNQTLYWGDQYYLRCSRHYHNLITRIYDAVYEQDPSFKDDLLALGLEEVCHTIGNADQSDTVLTEVEMIYQINRLRLMALAEQKLDEDIDSMATDPTFAGDATFG